MLTEHFVADIMVNGGYIEFSVLILTKIQWISYFLYVHFADAGTRSRDTQQHKITWLVVVCIKFESLSLTIVACIKNMFSDFYDFVVSFN